MGDADHVRGAVQAYADNGVDVPIVFALPWGEDRRATVSDHAARARCRDLAPGELRLAGAVLEERLRRRCAASSVPNTSTNASRFEVEPVGERHVRARRRSRASRAPSRRPRPCRARAAQCSASCSTSSGRHDPVDEPDRERLVGAHLPPAPDQLLGARRADESGQPLRAARAGNDAEQDLGLPDARVLATRRAGRTRIASSSPPPSA